MFYCNFNLFIILLRGKQGGGLYMELFYAHIIIKGPSFQSWGVSTIQVQRISIQLNQNKYTAGYNMGFGVSCSWNKIKFELSVTCWAKVLLSYSEQQRDAFTGFEISMKQSQPFKILCLVLPGRKNRIKFSFRIPEDQFSINFVLLKTSSKQICKSKF